MNHRSVCVTFDNLRSSRDKLRHKQIDQVEFEHNRSNMR